MAPLGYSAGRSSFCRKLTAVSTPVAFAVPLAAFAVATAIAELAGAANLGTALGVGQIAFALALVYVLLRG